MKTKTLLMLFTIISIVFVNCNDTHEQIITDADNLLMGNWHNATYDFTTETTSFKRTNALPKENYGISFKPKGAFLERTSGFCGTPPLSYFNVDGTYTLENNLVRIKSKNYLTNYTWRIIRLTETELVVKREFTEQEKEHQKLMDLFDELYTLADNNSCADANNFAFTGYGSKACGGVKGYLVYSKNIDTIAFLKKVKQYTEAEKVYNIKWAIISDCSVVTPPKKVECLNGYPTLLF